METKGQEINLLSGFPRVQRNVQTRFEEKTEEQRAKAKLFDRDYFDGDRSTGYGGYHYHPKFWTQVVQDFIQHYDLTESSSILDIGCAKGFMLYDFKLALPKANLAGLDISQYALDHAHPDIQEHLVKGNAIELPYDDDSFDLVISINTLHNLKDQQLKQGFDEMKRVSKQHSFVVLDAYRDNEEKEIIYQWNLTAQTIKSVDQWKEYFNQIDYSGDYYWFFP